MGYFTSRLSRSRQKHLQVARVNFLIVLISNIHLLFGFLWRLHRMMIALILKRNYSCEITDQALWESAFIWWTLITSLWKRTMKLFKILATTFLTGLFHVFICVNPRYTGPNAWSNGVKHVQWQSILFWKHFLLENPKLLFKVPSTIRLHSLPYRKVLYIFEREFERVFWLFLEIRTRLEHVFLPKYFFWFERVRI